MFRKKSSLGFVSFLTTDDLVRKMETRGVGENMSLTEFEK